MGLKGRKFKRNVYGLSLWTDVIKEVTIHYEMVADFKFDFSLPFKPQVEQRKELKRVYGLKPQIYVKGEQSSQLYHVNEIVIV